MSRRLPIALLAAAALTAAAAPAADAAIYFEIEGIKGNVTAEGQAPSQTRTDGPVPTDQFSVNFAKIEVKLPDLLITSYQTGGHGD